MGGTKLATAAHSGNSPVYCCIGAATAADRAKDETTGKLAPDNPIGTEKIYPQSGENDECRGEIAQIGE